MYRALVARRVRGVFDSLNRGDWRAPLRDVAADVHHVFPGDHPLGGERHSRDALARWFERLFRLFPGSHFEVKRVAVRGWPWDTSAAVQWVDRVGPAGGEPYVNEGAHWIRIRWAKVTEIHAYVDTQKVAEGCGQMAAAGIEEASAAPIVD